MTDRPVALVTGSAAGFGLLTSVELARSGFAVVATMRDPGRREKLDAAAREAGLADRITVERLDVADPASVEACAKVVLARTKALAVLVNNAGYGLGGFAEDVSDAELKAQFETNFFGAVRVAKAFLPGMREARSGTIINVSSIAGRMGTPGLSSYNASKWALEGWSESLAYELAFFGVRVVLVEPGTFRTEIFDRNRRMAARSQDPASPYFALTQRLTKAVDALLERSTADPRVVARLIASVASGRSRRLRYLVGVDARATGFLRGVLPAGLFETLVGARIRRMIGGEGPS